MTIKRTICAPATGVCTGAIAVVRLSGSDSLTITDKIFFPADKSKKFILQKPNTIRFGVIKDNDKIIDEVLVSVFKSPYSYTGEDSVEISFHGSDYIQKKILELLIKNGARTARPGEFTQRAFLNGKLDLSQAEAVADLISSKSETSHRIAMQQMRGGFSVELKKLRSNLLSFISLIELELDFGEEDVEFANRQDLENIINKIIKHIRNMIKSFKLGNVIKNGINVAIVGEPNVGKSTLLNSLLNDERAIVSDIPGTTRDSIEETISIDGIIFRFIDTAGIRKSDDIIENLGIKRTYQIIDKAEIIILVVEPKSNIIKVEDTIKKIIEKQKKLIVAINKIDTQKVIPENILKNNYTTVIISAKEQQNIDKLIKKLVKISNIDNNNEFIVTNIRHYEALCKAYEAGKNVIIGIKNNISGDFLAQDIHEILNQIGEITGEFTNDEVLQNIFRNFCIGK